MDGETDLEGGEEFGIGGDGEEGLWYSTTSI